MHHEVDHAARRGGSLHVLLDQPLGLQHVARAAGQIFRLDAQAGNGLACRILYRVGDEQNAPLRSRVLDDDGHQPLHQRSQFLFSGRGLGRCQQRAAGQAARQPARP